jgi:hypothetical protein
MHSGFLETSPLGSINSQLNPVFSITVSFLKVRSDVIMNRICALHQTTRTGRVEVCINPEYELDVCRRVHVVEKKRH